MTDKPFDFWQDHSARYLEMAFRWDKRERLEAPDGYGKRTGECGDTIEIFLVAQEGRIQFASFEADGCMNTTACANTVIHFAEGRTIEEAWEINAEMLVDYLETLPAEEVHCAELAVGSFYLALSDASKRLGEKGASSASHTEKEEWKPITNACPASSDKPLTP